MLIYLDIDRVIIPVSPQPKKAADCGFFISEKNRKLVFRFFGEIKKRPRSGRFFGVGRPPLKGIMSEANNPKGMSEVNNPVPIPGKLGLLFCEHPCSD